MLYIINYFASKIFEDLLQIFFFVLLKMEKILLFYTIIEKINFSKRN